MLRRRRHGEDHGRSAKPRFARTGARACATTDRVPFAYTCPSPSHYPWQWYWDSCFTAIAWRHFDPHTITTRARVAAGGAARGRVHRPHDLLEHAADGPPAVHLQRDLAERLDDVEHPAAGAGVGVADRGRRPGDRARDRPPLRLAERQPRPRRRRADLDRAARRVGPRRLAAVRRRCGAGAPTTGPGSYSSSGATASSDTTSSGSTRPAGRSARGRDERAATGCRCWRSAGRR